MNNREQSLYRARVCAVVSLVLFVAVVAAGSLRSAAEAPDRTEAVYMASYRIESFASERNEVRSRELEQLQTLTFDQTLPETVRAEAAERIMQLHRRMESESILCDVLCARGYEMPVVTVNDDSVNVVLHARTLSREEAGIILELVTRETGVIDGNVKIIPIN